MLVGSVYEWLKISKAKIAFASFALLTLPIIVFIIFFHDLKLGNPSDFADFATYFSGIIMPPITVLSVIALVYTIIMQRELAAEQQNAKFFESYLQRFDMTYQNFIKVSNITFPQRVNNPKLYFCLSEYKHMDSLSNKFQAAKDSIELIETVRKTVTRENISKQDSLNRRIKFYIDDLELEVEGAIGCLKMAYKFRPIENRFLILDIYRKSLNMITDLQMWKVISTERYEILIERIELPVELRP